MDGPLNVGHEAGVIVLDTNRGARDGSIADGGDSPTLGARPVRSYD
jgi:hypothetical protein